MSNNFNLINNAGVAATVKKMPVVELRDYIKDLQEVLSTKGKQPLTGSLKKKVEKLDDYYYASVKFNVELVMTLKNKKEVLSGKETYLEIDIKNKITVIDINCKNKKSVKYDINHFVDELGLDVFQKEQEMIDLVSDEVYEHNG